MSNESKIIDLPSEAAPGVPYFTPKQEPRAGTAQDPQPDGKPLPLLFTPLKIRGMELHNRITLAPLCQYSAQDGFPTAWHMAHRTFDIFPASNLDSILTEESPVGGIIKRGPGLSYTEASAVEPGGRVSPEDTGIWSDEHIAPWKEIVTFAHSQNQKIGIQLAHAGRKAATVAPFINFGMAATKAVGGWPDDVVGPTSERFSDTFHTPRELTVPEIKGLVQAFKDAAVRGLKAGFDTMQIHNAHGYLLHSFISPYSNKRTDEYGGSFENRIRLTLEVVDAVREVIPED
ncbi:NADH-dependent flavin oxidoreductase, partial [Marasmius crinis-equi]